MKSPAFHRQHSTPKTLVLGMGNAILTDDGVGIHVVRAAAARSSPENGAIFAETSVGGLRLLDLLVGYERVILIDAIQTGGGRPGRVYRLGLHDLQASLHSGSTHDLSLPGALALGRGIGMALPKDEDTVIVAVEVADVLVFGDECTRAVADAIPRAVELVLAELEAPVR
jgi:hydrogenase maturation protease